MVSTIQVMLCLKLVSMETDSVIYMQKIVGGIVLWNNTFEECMGAVLGRRRNGIARQLQRKPPPNLGGGWNQDDPLESCKMAQALFLYYLVIGSGEVV